jgi:DNA helicase-2/ATP-dependent DNA helicase PcrA
MSEENSSAYLDLLNEPQKQAVLKTEGPVMIIAGAGSGKTRVLTYRIAYMIEKGVDPFQILALTFTNKAAKEMRSRIEKVVGTQARGLWMGTFHSIFAKILRREAPKIGYPSNFTIYDTADSKNLIKSIVKEMKLDEKLYKPAIVLNRISSAKNNLITPDMYLGNDDITGYDSSTGRPEIARIYNAYAKRCFKSGAMDFDDLLLKTYHILTQHPDVLNKYQHQFRYVMVDEYQDTNRCQYMIVKKLAAVHENICVVGDDAQSIYSFRGATIKNILSFERDYPDLSVFKLEQNYRSTQTIVNAAGSIIANNKDQLEKKVWTDNDLGNKIKILRAVTDNEEARLITQSIFAEKMQNQRPNKEFAILYRTNAQSRSLEEALRKQNIPYRIYGGLSFYQRKEVKDLLAYLRLVVNPNDEEALKRVINYPTRGIGKTTIERITVIAAETGYSLWDVVMQAQDFPQLSTARNKLEQFVYMIKSFQILLEKGMDAYEVASQVAKSTKLIKTLYDDKTVEGVSRYENLVELLNGIKEFAEDDTSEQEKTLDVYLQDIALITDADKEDPNEDKVSLMTIHSAKGLEFPCVFISGLEENLFPSQMSSGSRKELEEERRLFYVGITRAEQQLTLSFSTSRFRFGQLLPCEPSRFLFEIDKEYIVMDASTFGAKASKSPVARGGQSSMNLKRKASKPRLMNNPAMLQRKKPPANPNFQAEDVSDLKVGDRIEHQRFGKGKVLEMDGEGGNKKAMIAFDEFGNKQLILRFAKLRFARD